MLLQLPDDAKLIKVAASTLGAKVLLHGDHDCCNRLLVPRRREDLIAKPDAKEVLYHLFAKIVVNAIDLHAIRSKVDVTLTKVYRPDLR